MKTAYELRYLPVFYDDLVESALTSAAAKIQPVMLIILGVVVGVMFIAVYSPILDMMTI